VGPLYANFNFAADGSVPVPFVRLRSFYFFNSRTRSNIVSCFIFDRIDGPIVYQRSERDPKNNRRTFTGTAPLSIGQGDGTGEMYFGDRVTNSFVRTADARDRTTKARFGSDFPGKLDGRVSVLLNTGRRCSRFSKYPSLS